MPKRRYGGYASQSTRKYIKYGSGPVIAALANMQGVNTGRKLRAANLRSGGFLGRENKFYDTFLLGCTIAGSTTVAGHECNPVAPVLLNTVAQGVSEENRIGRQIHMKSIQVKGVLHIPAQVNETALDHGGAILLSLVLDTQTNGVTINSEDVYKNKGANVLTGASLFRDLEQVNRFKILKTKKINLKEASVVWDGTNIEQSGYQIHFDMFKNLNRLEVNYCGTTSDVANIVDNSLHFLAFTSSTGYVPTIYYNARLRFEG